MALGAGVRRDFDLALGADDVAIKRNDAGGRGGRLHCLIPTRIANGDEAVGDGVGVGVAGVEDERSSLDPVGLGLEFGPIDSLRGLLLLQPRPIALRFPARSVDRVALPDLTLGDGVVVLSGQMVDGDGRGAGQLQCFDGVLVPDAGDGGVEGFGCGLLRRRGPCCAKRRGCDEKKPGWTHGGSLPDAAEGLELCG